MSDPHKILVIDDDPNIIDFCTTVLEASGYTLRAAASGAEGLALAQSEAPDLVILDIMMEEVDSGFQVAQQLSASGTPIIMLSSIAGATARTIDWSTLPVAELIDKPISPELLIKKVEKLLARRR